MNIKFTGKEDGSTLATVVMVGEGIDTPRFYRHVLPPDVNPWEAYSEVAQTAYDYLSGKSVTKATPTEKPTPKKMGRILQFQGVLT